MSDNIFKGLGIALVTPFTKDGQVDYKALERLVEFQIANGADFFCIMATTGEMPTLTSEEKMRIKEFVVDTVQGRLPIIIGCGGNNTKNVVEQLEHGNFKGIDGILSVCPYYNKPTQEGLCRHFSMISEATDLPIILYNVPGRTGVNLNPETTIRIASDCRNVVAIKEACGNLEQVKEIIKNKPCGFDVLSGDDALTYSMVECGAAGVISVIGNSMTKEFSKMLHLEMEGNFKAAFEIHNRLIELYNLLFVDGNPAGIKAMLSEMGMIENVLRLPLIPVQDSTSKRISILMKELSSSLH
ncbi:4-hydroxy-tetrahydrodipicolinate synthase [Prevotella sp. OH937_COT-195]|uniref:4-hydroxy-tetrahydrodipicolinate synthase n=1 Tax=Prevotella sp. OH937_COT-195 TaxID=2491051 RepID=UPI000F650456|nr:4-hydroxy-tetrahydrodipicolinate synthase [Prevotella sp. OH937_COT-195]RRD01872.1 4-hydroxy-tetrahydrodipicolinate synthase [Prevotella sp. OH937_COT-195]